jgi:predicted nucleic acid-binding protein
VWLAAYEPDEPFHAEAIAFLREARALAVEFLLPAMVIAEIAASSARRTRDASDGLRAIERVQRTPGVHFFGLSQERAVSAGELASRCFLKGADSTYAALALAEKADLVSLDRELRTRAAPEIATFTPAEWLARHVPTQP